MTSRFSCRLLMLVLGLATLVACRRGLPSTNEIEAGLRASPPFTERRSSPGGRELLGVTAVRQIGRTAVEVEFEWRMSAAPGAAAVPTRTSMGLFRRRDDGTWGLTSLYKID